MRAPVILVVEDDIVSGEALREKMSELGYEAPPLVTTGEDAIERAAALRPDLVLMDVRLAGEIDGIRAAGRISAGSDTPVIYLSAYADDEVLERARATAPYGYLVKPVRDKELTIAVGMALHRRDLEAKLNDHRQQLDAVFDHAPVIMMVVREDRRVERANFAALEATGRGPGDVRGRLVGQVLRCLNAINLDDCGTGRECEDCPVRLSVLKTFSSGEECRNVEGSLRLVPDVEASDRHFLLSTSLLDLRDGRRVLLMLNDVTAQKRDREALVRMHALYQDLIEGMGDEFLTFSLDRDGTVAYISPSSRALFGLDPADVIGKSWHDADAWGAGPLAHLDRLFQIVTAGGSCRHIEVDYPHPDGRLNSLSVTAHGVFDEEGRISRIEGIAEDVTEARQARLELAEAKDEAEAANRAKTAFLANMSHEIRTPLNAVMGYAQLMAREPCDSPTHAEYVDIIARSGRHLASLVDGVLEMSKIEAGRMELAPSEIDLPSLIGDVEAMFRSIVKAHGLRLTFVGVEDLPRRVRADGAKIRQVLINMLGNAVKHTREGGVEVRGTVLDRGEEEYRIELDVVDTGCGIAADELDTVFEPFEQTASGRRSADGTGLGMAISKSYARLMHGDLTVRSTPGEGSAFCFVFTVPVASSSPGERRRQSSGPLTVVQRPEGWRVLVVDDIEDDRELTARVLKRAGIDVRTVMDGAEAVDVVASWRPHAVLMDRRMPGIDGLEAMRRIRDLPHGVHVPVIVLSASSTDVARGEALDAGASGFVAKPCTESALLEVLRSAAGVAFQPGPTGTTVASEALSRWGIAAVLDPALAQGLPAAIRADLRAAVEEGDMERLLGILADAELADTEAVATVRTLAETYRYEDLLTLLADGRATGGDDG
jgi:PAS domain S-box-containing protein